MDFSEVLSYFLALTCVVVGGIILWGNEAYIVPASGRSLRLPCSFFFLGSSCSFLGYGCSN
jgi:hypothetical protein